MNTWNEAIQMFGGVVDKLGKKIDGGIFETVVTLNLLGILTTQSCEGHINWGLPYPWISVDKTSDPRYRLYQYLEQFYAEKSRRDFDRTLMLYGYRLQSLGAVFAPQLSEEIQREKLRAYQAEMLAFTRFLKTFLAP
jgi:hypothetical protein